MIYGYKITILITALLLALIAGLFYSYSVSVNPGLGKLADREYLRAMQSINRAILNPAFFISFMGSLLLLPVSTWLLYRYEGLGISFYLVLAAAIVYIVGVFGVTMFGNVPLNNTLDKLNLDEGIATDFTTWRANFEIPWNRLHGVRTFANIVSLLLFLAGIMKR
jgi:uncharacterized membrane protein